MKTRMFPLADRPAARVRVRRGGACGGSRRGGEHDLDSARRRRRRPKAEAARWNRPPPRPANTGRAVAMSLIGLAFAVAATVLAFRRDFKEAAGVFAVGIVSVLLATPAGVSLLRDTVTSLFGSQ